MDRVFENSRYAADAIAMKFRKDTRERILQALARGYCSEKNSMKEVDSDLLESQADEIEKFILECL